MHKHFKPRREEATMLRLAQERKAAGWTKMELGRRAYIHPARVGQIENGRVRPPADSVELQRLATALHYEGDPKDLLSEADVTAGID
jgi:transcriptional regulator with XRE-family HTH domain